jgi:hypothetical protein
MIQASLDDSVSSQGRSLAPTHGKKKKKKKKKAAVEDKELRLERALIIEPVPIVEAPEKIEEAPSIQSAPIDPPTEENHSTSAKPEPAREVTEVKPDEPAEVKPEEMEE